MFSNTNIITSSRKLESSDEVYGWIVEKVENQESQKSSSQESQKLKANVGEKVES